eukprot:TRINITY_DN3064_c0_g5_i1.p1 TRINITY_DN3064_c0_g5~~TRINITY_DN3064_c0_g5_i1.p1  ORF type:complete len:136 (-),score=9.63 TRINITY_DN3064_c0_g5_i1:67-474(-)
MAEDNPWTDKLKAVRDWDKAVMYTQDGQILASTFVPDQEEINHLLSAFDVHDVTVSKGIFFDGVHHDVHRFYPDLIYGRAGQSSESSGVALSKTVTKDKESTIFVAIKFSFPIVSARAVSLLREFAQKNIEASAL